MGRSARIRRPERAFTALDGVETLLRCPGLL